MLGVEGSGDARVVRNHFVIRMTQHCRRESGASMRWEFSTSLRIPKVWLETRLYAEKTSMNTPQQSAHRTTLKINPTAAAFSSRKKEKWSAANGNDPCTAQMRGLSLIVMIVSASKTPIEQNQYGINTSLAIGAPRNFKSERICNDALSKQPPF